MTDCERCGRCGADITNVGMNFGTVWMSSGEFDDAKGDYTDSVVTHLCIGCYGLFKRSFREFLDTEQEGD